MKKPIILIREEFIENLKNMINDSGLPAFIIAPILSDFLLEIKAAEKRQYVLEKEQYEQFLRLESDK